MSYKETIRKITKSERGLRKIAKSAAKGGDRFPPSEISKKIESVVRHRMKTGQIGNKKPLGLSPHARAEYGRILRRLTRGVTKTATKTAGKIVGKTAAKTVAKTAAKTAGKASIRGLGVIGAGITAFEVGRYVGKKIMEHPKAKKAGIKHIGKPLLKAETKIRSAIKRKLGGK